MGNALRMGRISLKQLQRVGNQVNHSLQRFHRAPWISRQVQDQRLASSATDAAAEGSKSRFLGTFPSHPFGQSLDHAVADRTRSLRSDVARCDSRPSGGRDESHLRCQTNKQVLDFDLIVRNYLASNYMEA